MEKKYNNLDKAMTKIMLDGEKQCLHRRERATPWSTQLMSESYKLYYWSLKISSLKRERRSTLRRLGQAAIRAGIQDTPMTLQEATTARAAARKIMHTVLARAKELRRAELEKRAEAYAEAGNQPMEIVLRELINREKSKNTWRKIKRALDTSSRATLTKLIIPMLGTEEEKTITTKDEIHESIINYNIEHYSKPESSPFGLGQFLCDAIGPHGTSQFSDRILAGDLTEADRKEIQFEEAYELLQCMQYQELPNTVRRPATWITDSITKLLNLESENSDEESDREEEKEYEHHQ